MVVGKVTANYKIRKYRYASTVLACHARGRPASGARTSNTQFIEFEHGTDADMARNFTLQGKDTTEGSFYTSGTFMLERL